MKQIHLRCCNKSAVPLRKVRAHTPVLTWTALTELKEAHSSTLKGLLHSEDSLVTGANLEANTAPFFLRIF